MATDSFPAQARGNELALRRSIPAVFIGLYEEGRGGEIVFWHPGLDPCFRCLCSARYAAFAAETATAITSHGATVLDIRIVDGIAAMTGPIWHMLSGESKSLLPFPHTSEQLARWEGEGGALARAKYTG